MLFKKNIVFCVITFSFIYAPSFAKESLYKDQRETLVLNEICPEDSNFSNINFSCLGYECAQKLEIKQIKRYSKIVRRDRNKLVLKLFANKQKVLLNTDAKKEANEKLHTEYNFREYFSNLGYFLVQVASYEDCEFMLINQKNGTETTILNLPIFSPRKTKFIVTLSDACALGGYTNDSIQIYSILNKGISPEWSLDFKENITAHVRWIDEETLFFTECDIYKCYLPEKKIRRINGKWKILKQ